MFVAAFSLLVSGLLLGIDIPVSDLAGDRTRHFHLDLLVHRLGLICAGVGLRVRETAVLNNVIFGLLLVFTGANVPIDQLPGWMQAISDRIPFTHGIEAARQVADGASIGDVSGLLATEAVIGIAYTLVGYAVLRFMELESRRRASLQVA